MNKAYLKDSRKRESLLERVQALMAEELKNAENLKRQMVIGLLANGLMVKLS